MISTVKITKIFCSIDDFCIVFEPSFRKNQISTGKKTRNRKFKMSTSEILTITVLFHLSGFRNFKHYYIFMFKNILHLNFQKQSHIIDLPN